MRIISKVCVWYFRESYNNQKETEKRGSESLFVSTDKTNGSIQMDTCNTQNNKLWNKTEQNIVWKKPQT